MKATYQNWPAMAEDAEARGDWREAKRCWYYAAQNVNGNPRNLRTYYCEREDAAGERMSAEIYFRP
jgi:hypothetical protein